MSYQGWRFEKKSAARPESNHTWAVRVCLPDDRIIFKIWLTTTLQPFHLKRLTIPLWKDLNLLNRQSRSQWYRFSQWKSRILTKLVTGGLYNTQSHHSTKWASVCTPGGHQGALFFLLYEKWMLQIRHLWVSKKNMSWWPERGPKGRPKGSPKKFIRLLFDPPGPLKGLLPLGFSMAPWGVRT